MDSDSSCTNGAVASAHFAASYAGIQVLKRGGNVVDAIVTTALTLSAVLPPFSGIGGGGFLMLHLASEDKTIFVDYREVAPSHSRRDMFASDSTANSIGHLAIAVPGTINGLSLVLEKYGTMGMDEALKPGIELAAKGTTVTKTLKRATDSNLAKLRRFPRSDKTFLRDGNSPEIGTVVKFPELSKTYEKIAQRGVDEFYKGDTAQRILEEIEGNGGILKSSDLASYEAVEREPIRFSFGEYEFFLPPPPSAGGIQMAQALSALEAIASKASKLDHNSYEYLILLSNILGTTFADRGPNIADPDFFTVDV
ncbi:MAG: gamma-glutamyltransferase, partial [Thaumarchaeota archaeon]|nr:gamma-glutamyltransferase [Nitrososphaerota archaeon]